MSNQKRFNVRKWKNISIIVSGMLATSTVTFNCAPSMFQASQSSSQRSLGTTPAVDEFKDVGRSPIALMSVNETFESMVTVTGQTNAVPASMRAELTVRAGALADNPLVTNINAPLQLAATALAGEACNGLIVRESGAGAARKFFAGVDFTKAPSAQPANAFVASVGAMARAFWNRSPSAEEMAMLQEFASTLPEGAAVKETKGIYLGACTAMLASFDAITL